MQQFSLTRTGLPPLRFLGERVASSEGGRVGTRDQTRWHDVSIFQAATGWVGEVVFRTRWDGESDRHTVYVCATPSEVAAALAAHEVPASGIGFPVGSVYADKQQAMLADLRARLAAQVSEVLADAGDEFAEDLDAGGRRAETLPPSRRPDAGGYTVTCSRWIPPRPGSVGLYAVDPWALATVVPCRACGGSLLWAEAGYVPGYRLCEQCGRPWLVEPGLRDADTIALAVRIPETSEGPAWNWTDGLAVDGDSYAEYVNEVTRFGGTPASRSTWEHYRGPAGG